MASRPSEPKLKVYVVPRRRRGVWLFRWLDPVSGRWAEKVSGVPIGGPSKRDEQKSRSIAERAAVDWEEALNAAPAAEDLFAPLIDAYVEKVRGGGASAKHLERIEAHLIRFADEARTRDGKQLATVRQITEDVVIEFLARLTRKVTQRKSRKPAQYKRKFRNAREPAPPPPEPEYVPASQGTKNHYLVTLKAFCGFLTDREFFPKNPVRGVRKASTKTDLRRQRRTLTAEEFARLVNAAQAGPPIMTVTGRDRAMLYILAAWTGLRRRELSSLTLRSFTLDGAEPCLRLKANWSKRRREDVVPLHPAVAEAVKDWLQSRGVVAMHENVFPLTTAGGGLRNTAEMMKRDLAAAGLPYRDDDGLFADFHANRAAFITNLIESGVHIFRAQRLARHSDPKTTAIYDKSDQTKLAKEVEKLASPPKLVSDSIEPPPQTLRFGTG